MKTYTLKVQFEAADDSEIFREIVIAEGQHLEHLHKTIVKSFDFDGDEMASFYLSDENWEKGQEYPLEDMGDEGDEIVIMKKAKVEDLVSDAGDRLVYIYDFMKMNTFLIELLEVGKKVESKKYPLITKTVGELPEDDVDDEDGDEDDDLFGDDPDLAESYFTPVSKPSGGKKGKKIIEEDEEDLFDDFQDGFDDDDFGSKGDFDDYY